VTSDPERGAAATTTQAAASAAISRLRTGNCQPAGDGRAGNSVSSAPPGDGVAERPVPARIVDVEAAAENGDPHPRGGERPDGPRRRCRARSRDTQSRPAAASSRANHSATSRP
jgi:hypothetical protein